MKYRTIIVEDDKTQLENISPALKHSKEFDLLTIYDQVESALGQSSVYAPDLFIIDIENPDFLEELPAFKNAFPDAEILAMLSAWDNDVAFEAQNRGAIGTILKGYKSDEILETMKISKQRGKNKPTHVASFFSPKGRAGRTTLAALLAQSVHKKTGESVAMIDADLQFGDLPTFFDVEPQHTIVDSSHDIKLLTPLTFLPYYHKIQDGFYLLGGPSRPEFAELVDSDTVIEVIRLSSHLFRYIFVDLPAGFNPISLAVSNYADTNFVVSMYNSEMELVHMRRSLDMFRDRQEMGKSNFAIFTRIDPCTEDQRFKMELSLGHPLTAIFPNDYHLISTADSGRIMKELPNDQLLMGKINDLTNKIIAEDG